MYDIMLENGFAVMFAINLIKYKNHRRLFK